MPKRAEDDKENKDGKKPEKVVVPVQAPEYGKQKNKLQPIFQVTFDFDPNKKPQ